MPKSRLRVIIEHYNGKTWRKTALPKLGPCRPGGGPRRVRHRRRRAQRRRATAVPVSATTGGSEPGIVALHYNGKAWAQVKVPYPVTLFTVLFLVAQDGKGGIWLSADQLSSGAYRPFLYHDSGGHLDQGRAARRPWRRDGVAVHGLGPRHKDAVGRRTRGPPPAYYGYPPPPPGYPPPAPSYAAPPGASAGDSSSGHADAALPVV